jgi:hypothetical protein
MNFLLYNIIFKHNSSTFNIISNINILVLYWIVIFFKLFFNPIPIVKANRCALFFSFFVQHKKSGLLKKAGLFASTLGAVVVGTSANAAPITFDTADLLANIGAGEGFAITAGLAFIGLTATISVLRKSRGAVR